MWCDMLPSGLEPAGRMGGCSDHCVALDVLKVKISWDVAEQQICWSRDRNGKKIADQHLILTYILKAVEEGSDRI